MNITEDDARTILEMQGVCLNEGIGPDSDELLDRIAKEFPNLREEYMWQWEWRKD